MDSAGFDHIKVDRAVPVMTSGLPLELYLRPLRKVHFSQRQYALSFDSPKSVG